MQRGRCARVMSCVIARSATHQQNAQAPRRQDDSRERKAVGTREPCRARPGGPDGCGNSVSRAQFLQSFTLAGVRDQRWCTNGIFAYLLFSLRLCAFAPLCLCAFTPLCLCAFAPLRLCAFAPFRFGAFAFCCCFCRRDRCRRCNRKCARYGIFGSAGSFGASGIAFGTTTGVGARCSGTGMSARSRDGVLCGIGTGITVNSSHPLRSCVPTNFHAVLGDGCTDVPARREVHGPEGIAP